MSKIVDEASFQTLLAFDYGTQKIGCAVGNRQLQTSSPLMLVQARNGVPDWNQVTAIVADWNPDAMVIGLPDNMDGSNSAISERARKFSRQLKERYRIPCFLMDERLTSYEARDHLKTVDEVRGRAGKAAKKIRNQPAVDAVAAQLILQSWYQTRARLQV